MKRPGRLRALVLAAGHGERLRPLTADLPKPLLPVGGASILAHTLRQLAALGCERAVVNLHHRGEAIPRALGESLGGMALSYSRESELLGTWGAIGGARELLLPADDLLVVNGDSLCRWPLAELLARHRRGTSTLTLLVSSRVEAGRYGGGIGLDRRGRVRELPGSPADPRTRRRRVFLGAHCLAPELAATAPRRRADLVPDLWLPLLAAGGRIDTVSTPRRWHDLGTPERYLEATLEWTLGRRTGSWLGLGAEVHADARLRRVVLEEGVRVEAGADLEEVVALPGARVGRGSRLRRVVLGPGVEVAPGEGLAGAVRAFDRGRERTVASLSGRRGG